MGKSQIPSTVEGNKKKKQNQKQTKHSRISSGMSVFNSANRQIYLSNKKLRKFQNNPDKYIENKDKEKALHWQQVSVNLQRHIENMTVLMKKHTPNPYIVR